MDYELVKAGEFKRLAEVGAFHTVLAKESITVKDKFHLFGINTQTRKGFIIRHGRTDDWRVWRIDNLIKFCKEVSLYQVDIAMNKPPESH